MLQYSVLHPAIIYAQICAYVMAVLPLTFLPILELKLYKLYRHVSNANGQNFP